MKTFASHNADAGVRRASSAGGVFSLLAASVIDGGGVVYGAAFDGDWRVVHRRVDRHDGLAALRGSKYAYSSIGSAVADAMADLDAGRRVLFSGTPCQVAAMRRRAGDHPALLLVEVVCHGAPEHKYWDSYIDALCRRLHRRRSDIAAISFRDKCSGWKGYSFTVRFADGLSFTEPHDDNLYMRAFLSDLTLRPACFRCPFKYPDGSRADITLGDLWGIAQIAPEIDNDLGTTLVVVRTAAGEQAAATLGIDKPLDFADAARHNPALISSVAIPDRRAGFLAALDRPGASLLTVMRRFAARPLRQRLYLRAARLKHRLLKLIKPRT